MKYFIDQQRQKDPNLLLLNAGEQGMAWTPMRRCWVAGVRGGGQRRWKLGGLWDGEADFHAMLLSSPCPARA